MKKIRKYLMAFAAVLCCATATSVLTSCGSDDNPTEQAKDTKAVAVNGRAVLTVSQDILDNYNITIEYSDGTKSQRYQFQSTTYTMTFQPQLPAKLTFTVTATLKSGKELSSVDLHTNEFTLTPVAYSVNAAGENISKVSLVSHNGGFFIAGASKTFIKVYSCSLSSTGDATSWRVENSSLETDLN